MQIGLHENGADRDFCLASVNGDAIRFHTNELAEII